MTFTLFMVFDIFLLFRMKKYCKSCKEELKDFLGKWQFLRASASIVVITGMQMQN